MAPKSEGNFIAFAGNETLKRGKIREVARACKISFDNGVTDRLSIFDDHTGRAIDLDLSGSTDEVLDRIASHPLFVDLPAPAPAPTGPGRPRLGVISREVSLLPRHWEWLSNQRGGASARIRLLIDEQRARNSGQERVSQAIEAAHRFMWDIAGDKAGFEEASRALFAQDFDKFNNIVNTWPPGIREQLKRFLERAGSPTE